MGHFIDVEHESGLVAEPPPFFREVWEGFQRMRKTLPKILGRAVVWEILRGQNAKLQNWRPLAMFRFAAFVDNRGEVEIPHEAVHLLVLKTPIEILPATVDARATWGYLDIPLLYNILTVVPYLLEEAGSVLALLDLKAFIKIWYPLDHPSCDFRYYRCTDLPWAHLTKEKRDSDLWLRREEAVACSAFDMYKMLMRLKIRGAQEIIARPR